MFSIRFINKAQWHKGQIINAAKIRFYQLKIAHYICINLSPFCGAVHWKSFTRSFATANERNKACAIFYRQMFNGFPIANGLNSNVSFSKSILVFSFAFLFRHLIALYGVKKRRSYLQLHLNAVPMHAPTSLGMLIVNSSQVTCAHFGLSSKISIEDVFFTFATLKTHIVRLIDLRYRNLSSLGARKSTFFLNICFLGCRLRIWNLFWRSHLVFEL